MRWGVHTDILLSASRSDHFVLSHTTWGIFTWSEMSLMSGTRVWLKIGGRCKPKWLTEATRKKIDNKIALEGEMQKQACMDGKRFLLGTGFCSRATVGVNRAHAAIKQNKTAETQEAASLSSKLVRHVGQNLARLHFSLRWQQVLVWEMRGVMTPHC